MPKTRNTFTDASATETQTDAGDDVSLVSESLRRGLACKRWWQEAHRSESYANKFPLTRSFNRPQTGFGFFDALRIDGELIPVMGSVSEETYDWCKTEELSKQRDELREFVLRYFLRISDFRLPEAYVDDLHLFGSALRAPFCWCTKPVDTRRGFGYSQIYYLDAATGKKHDFASDSRFEIIDLRSIGKQFQWVVLKVRIFDFDLTFRPFGNAGPEFRFPLSEDSNVIVSPEFIVDRTESRNGIVGEFGFGYAVHSQNNGGQFLAYGPGQFNVGFSEFSFRLLSTGETRITRVFVVNRPFKILDIPLNPLRFAERVARWISNASLGRTSRFGPDVTIDPIFGSVSLANVFTLGLADQLCCISREQIERQMLIQHFMQNYEMIVGSQNTWRQIPNWQDHDSLPVWAITGVSS